MKSRFLRAALLAIAPTLILAAVIAIPAEASSAGLTVSSNGHAVYGGITQGTLQIQSKPLADSGYSIQSVEIDIKFSGGSVCAARGSTSAALTWDSSSYPSSACGSSSLSGKTPNSSVTIASNAVEKTCPLIGSCTTKPISGSITVNLNNAPTPPAWAASPTVSGASKNQPVVTLRWNASPEPDIQEYRFLRTDPSGNTKQYPVQASNPSAQGCSESGTTYTCYDTDFPSSGFGGTYSYTLVAYRSSPSQADTCYYPNQQTPCIGATSTDVRSVSIVQPTPSPAATGGTGGSTGGPGGTGGGSFGGTSGGVGTVPTGVPSVASANQSSQQSRTAVQGQTFNPGDCFTCGTYGKTLPYGSLPGDGQSGTITVPGSGQGPIAAGAGIGSGSSGPDPRQLWVSIAAGLVLLLTAGHVARVLRTTAR